MSKEQLEAKYSDMEYTALLVERSFKGDGSDPTEVQ